MSTYDWSTFTRKININAPVSAIYDAWTVPELMERWFLREAHFFREKSRFADKNMHIRKGDHYEWYWHGFSNEIVEKGEVLMANETDKLQFSFTGGGIVTVDIGHAMDETIVMLTQDKIPTDDKGRTQFHLGCLTGWTFYLANLKSVIEGGIDLRNKNIALTNMVNS
ncbi:MAG: SRPBCC domain-containing protein [Sphingobacteriales bacterium]|nr:MAG: SRPBCC domain-containing protein [Sphingobacteriales bacterium]